jgi:hypothetical protein
MIILKLNLNKAGWESAQLISLVRDRDQQQALVNKVTTFELHKMQGHS